ncbi:MAG: OmpA family protein [Myxococcales bacterium]|nr:OmpA family protein [Myxococcales bacterium]
MKFKTAIAAATLASVVGAGPAWADDEAKAAGGQWPAWHVGVSLGGHLVITDWGSATANEDTGLYESADHSFIGRLRFGGQFSDLVGIEASVGYLPISAAGEDHTALEYDLGVLLFFSNGTWRPFFGVGAGVYHFPDGEMRDPIGDTRFATIKDESDIDPMLWYGLGLRAMATDWFAVRGDIRHIYTDGLEPDGPSIASNFEVSLGVDFLFGGGEPPPPPPADKDGDGVPDADDKCVDQPGDKANAGCPGDKDGDGIIDAEDKCPDDKGTQSLAGCPDSDGDGIIDDEDQCPDVAGTAELKGCSDKDGDGVLDHEDRCPEKKGKAQWKGCGDMDGDEVPDPDDLCPKVQGPKDRKGCPPPPKEIQEKFSGSIEGIFFETGSAELKAESNKILDEAAEVMNKFGDLKLEIDGHTDDVGKDDANLKLSQDRADAVKQALTERGVKADRMKATGFGETKPAMKGTSKKARAKNRRIEFKIVQPD